MSEVNHKLQAKYKIIDDNEIRYHEYRVDDAEFLITSFGLSARISMKVIDLAREQGIKLGMFRPITLWPYPYKRLNELSDKIKAILDFELNAGQMVEDVRLAVEGKTPVYFYGEMGGIIPSPDSVLEKILEIINKHK